ncbi:BREX system serine/threonine kinase PglW [Geodermatophilus sp. SYSU D00965]
MRSDSPRWTQVTPSAFAWEREALEHVKALLPDAEPYRAWANFEFVADDGTVNEVDLLVACPRGLYLVEIKSRPGRLTGDAGTWTWRGERTRTDDNPLLLANRKAKKLKSMLERAARPRRARVPFVQAVVLLHGPGIDVQLDPAGRAHVYAPDSDLPIPRPGALPRIGRELLTAPADDQRRGLDAMTSKALVGLVNDLGIRQSRRLFTIGQYEITMPPLDEGPGWQDFAAKHVDLHGVKARVRIYLVEKAASQEHRRTVVRAAEREFRLLSGMQHPGIVQVQAYVEHDLGPALIFSHEPSSVRLDHYLRDSLDRLTVDARLAMVRQLAETLRYAHSRHLVHRALSPRSILVIDPDAAVPRLKVLDWQTGGHAGTTTATTTSRVQGTSHLDRLTDRAVESYLAPEALVSPDARGVPLDLFALGAVTFHLFAGRAPASSAVELSEVLRGEGGLRLDGAVDGVSSRLAELVAMCTAPEVDSRLDSAELFLEELDAVEEELTAPEDDTVDPLDAHKGDRLDGGLTVVQRLGSGSTALALLVEGGELAEPAVLKVALDADKEQRLVDEAEVLNRVHHAGVVRLLGEVSVSGRFGLLLERAGDRTLAQQLREDGRLHLDLLERFGTDLLQVVDHIDGEGVAHRDIKPDNLGARPRRRDRQPHLVLFDFSLAKAPIEAVRAGTSVYLDPFLGSRSRPHWDPAAERYAAAVTLYEMATGTLPAWGDGETAPALLDDEVTLEPELMDSAVAEELTDFFRTALRRDAAQRFPTAEAMLASWRRIFAALGEAAGEESAEEDARDEAAARATITTPLAQAGISARGVAALERFGVSTVGEALAVPSYELTRMRGVGDATRREVRSRIREWRLRLARTSIGAPSPSPGNAVSDAVEPQRSVDAVLASLLPGGGVAVNPVVTAYLGLHRPGALGTSTWPSEREISEAVRVPPEQVSRETESARSGWLSSSLVSDVREDVVRLLADAGRVATPAELGEGLLAVRGSAAPAELRRPEAVALARLAVETELADPAGSRLWLGRARGRVPLVALEPTDDDPTMPPAEALVGWARRLAVLAEELAGTDPLPGPARVRARLVEEPPPEGYDVVDPDRLVRLAASASTMAAASPRLELYPRDLDPIRALRLAQGALTGAGVDALSEKELRGRVAARFPVAPSLPQRPRLDALIEESGLPLSWDPVEELYRLGGREGFISATTRLPSRVLTATSTASIPASPEVRAAVRAESRLTRSVKAGGFLALVVRPRLLPRAVDELARRFAMTEIDVTAQLIEEMRTIAQRAGVPWELVVAADAAEPGSRDATNLSRLVADAVPGLRTRLRGAGEALILSEAAVLARYGAGHVLTDLINDVGRSGSGLRTLWLAVPEDRSGGLPMLDREPVPVMTSNQWLRLPDSWVSNAHRGSATSKIEGSNA